MRIGVHLTTISAALAAFTAFGSAQGTRVVRWDESYPISKRVLYDGIVAKQVVVEEISLTASILDRGDSFIVQVELTDAGRKAVDVRPESVELQVVRPRFRALAFIPAPTLATSVKRSAAARAAGVEGQGSVATMTVHEQAIVHASVTLPDCSRIGLRHVAVPSGEGFVSTPDVEDARQALRAAGFFKTAFALDDTDPETLHEQVMARLLDEVHGWVDQPA